jgi:ubiquinone/menaquinone biosynthesis C-methylase UbiE
MNIASCCARAATGYAGRRAAKQGDELGAPWGSSGVQVRSGQHVLMPAATSTLDRYERIAAFYDLLDLPFEYRRYRKIRPLLFAGLSGLILDAGVGTGRNFPFYPQGANIVGIDLSPAMLARAERRRSSAAAEVELRQMDVTHLDFPDRFFDATVATFLFCVLPDELQVPALKEIGRVVKAGGIIRLLEYTRPRTPLRRAMTKLWEPWVRWAYGASFDRRTQEHIPEAGLQLIEARFVIDELIQLISARPVC